jgi:hypothetical protein
MFVAVPIKGIRNKIIISQDLLYTFMGYTITLRGG